MEIKIEKLDEKAVLPFQAREGDFCYDVVAVSEEEVKPNIWRYGLGFRYEIVRSDIMIGYAKQKYNDHLACYAPVYLKLDDAKHSSVKLSIDFRPRSSVWETGMILSNCEGTLDEFYRGEAKAVFYHVFSNLPRYKVGDKIGQIKLGMTLPLKFIEVKNISTDTDRGTGGFGSSGKSVVPDLSSFLAEEPNFLTTAQAVETCEILYNHENSASNFSSYSVDQEEK